MNIEAKRKHRPQDGPMGESMNGPKSEQQDRHAIIATAFP